MRPQERKRILSLLRSRIDRECDIKRHRHGAAIVAPNGRVVSVGVNIRGSGFSSQFSYHAEEMAIIRAARKGGIPRFSSLLVARLKSDGEWGLSQPCDRCDMVIRESGIKRVEYTL